MKRIDVSIIVPIYNVERYLTKCLDSIINQTYKNLEVILVDDGSTDSSGIICDKYAEKDNRIKVIHKSNEGVVEARIDGLKNSCAEYIMFIDSDDYILEDTINLMYSEILKQKVDMVCCQYSLFENNESNKAPLKPLIGYYDKDAIKKLLMEKFLYDKMTENGGFNLYLWSKLIKRENLLEALELGRGLFRAEDQIALLYLLYNIESMTVISNYLYFYRRRIGQTTSMYSDELWENFDLYFQKIKFLDSHNYLKEQVKCRSLTTLIKVIDSLFSQKNFTEARNIINKYKRKNFYATAKSNSYNDFSFKTMIKLFFIKHELWLSYYWVCKMYKKLKESLK